MQRERTLAYNIAALSGAAFSGTLKTMDEHFPPEVEAPKPIDPVAAALALHGAMLTLKGRGIHIVSERIPWKPKHLH